MSLEELKAAMDLALAELAKDPENAELKAKSEAAKTAYEEAKAAADGSTDDDFDEESADEKTKKYLKKLRDENAKHRTKAKDAMSKLKAEEEKRKAILKAAGIDDPDEQDVETKFKNAEAEKQTLAFRNAILTTAVQHNVPSEQIEYFEFLITKAADELDEGEELSDEALTEIVNKAKKSGGTKSANSSVNGSGGGTPKPGSGKDDITLDKFIRMSMNEKSKLYTTNEALYLSFMAEAKAKKKLV